MISPRVWRRMRHSCLIEAMVVRLRQKLVWYAGLFVTCFPPKGMGEDSKPIGPRAHNAVSLRFPLALRKLVVRDCTLRS